MPQSSVPFTYRADYVFTVWRATREEMAGGKGVDSGRLTQLHEPSHFHARLRFAAGKVTSTLHHVPLKLSPCLPALSIL